MLLFRGIGFNGLNGSNLTFFFTLVRKNYKKIKATKAAVFMSVFGVGKFCIIAKAKPSSPIKPLADRIGPLAPM